MAPAMRFIKHVLATALALGLAGPSALADVVVAVSAKSPVATLSNQQVVDIFLGKSNRFPNGEQAVPIDQAEGSPLRDEFYASVAGKSAAQIKAHWSKIIFTGRGQPPREAANSSETKKLLAKNPNAIGYVDKSDLDGSIKALTISPW